MSLPAPMAVEAGAAPSTPVGTTLRLVQGDQFDPQHDWYRELRPDMVYLLLEMRRETDYAVHHAQEVIAIFAAMRDFARQPKAAPCRAVDGGHFYTERCECRAPPAPSTRSTGTSSSTTPSACAATTASRWSTGTWTGWHPRCAQRRAAPAVGRHAGADRVALIVLNALVSRPGSRRAPAPGSRIARRCRP